MVLLILKEQQPNQISQDQAKSLQQMHLMLEKEAPFQIDSCVLSVPSHSWCESHVPQKSGFVTTPYHHASTGFHKMLDLVTRDCWWLQVC